MASFVHSAPEPRRRFRITPRRVVTWSLMAVGVLLLLAVTPVLGAIGLFGPRTYLVLVQNPTELRQYGGFMGTYGEVTLAWGRVADLSYGDTLSFDELYEEMLEEGELEEEFEPNHLYAPSESPDFPTAAEAAAWIYAQLTDTEPDGVIGIDFGVASNLLRLVGPITIDGEPEPVTESNVLALILKHTQEFDDDNDDRKQFAIDVAYTLAAELRQLPMSRWPDIVRVMTEAADERKVQVYMRGRVLQRLIAARGWDGAYPPARDDFLAVVDSNVGYNKANLVTDQSLDYHVTIDQNGDATAELTVSYVNRGTKGLGFSTVDMPFVHDATYEGQIWVYAPIDSRRLPPGDADDTWEDLDRQVFEQVVQVPPESQASTTVRYQLPNRKLDSHGGHYDLFVRKQAGTIGVPLRVRVTVPEGWRVGGTGSREWSTDTRLTVDRTFSVQIERP